MVTFSKVTTSSLELTFRWQWFADILNLGGKLKFAWVRSWKLKTKTPRQTQHTDYRFTVKGNINNPKLEAYLLLSGICFWIGWMYRTFSRNLGGAAGWPAEMEIFLVNPKNCRIVLVEFEWNIDR